MRRNPKMMDVKWIFNNMCVFIICFEYSVWNVTSDLTYQPQWIGLLTGCPLSVVHVVRHL
jgi:hypothetical protein